MSYRRKSKINTRAVGTTVFIVVISLLGFLHVPFPPVVQDTFRAVAIPLFSLGDSLKKTQRNVFTLLVPKADLLREQEQLRDQLRRSNLTQAENTLLKNENRRLRELIGYTENQNYMTRPVIANPPETPYDSLIISTLGVAVARDTLVFAPNESVTAIGTVSRLLGKTTDVKLFSHPGTSQRVFIGEDRVPAQTAGVGGGNMTAEVPEDAPIKTGDAVVLAGTIEPYLIGSVMYVEDHPHDAEATVHIQLPINLFSLSHVSLSSVSLSSTDPFTPIHDVRSTTTQEY